MTRKEDKKDVVLASEKGNQMKGKIKVMKAADCYVKLYGHKAYDAYVKREAEIDILMSDKRIKMSTIVRMREVNFRRMKEAGAQRGMVVPDSIVGMKRAA